MPGTVPARHRAQFLGTVQAVTPGDHATFRRFHEAVKAGDLDTVLDCVEPDVVVRPLHGLLFTRMEFRGHNGIRDWYHEMTDPYDRYEPLVEEVHDHPDGVAGLVTLIGYRGDEGLHARVGVVCEMREGRIASLTARNASDVEDEIRAQA
jgi:ketosteroid isomerase-like protein